MSQYPKAMYKAGGVELVDGEYFTTAIAADEAQENAMRRDGWHLSAPDALKGSAATAPAEDPAPDDAAPASAHAEAAPADTRADLESKARELGLKFDGR